MTSLNVSSAVEQLVSLGFDREHAEREARAQLGAQRSPDTAAEWRTEFDGMNKTERRRWVELEAMKRAGVIRDCKYNAVTLMLANRCRYTPDFLVEHVDSRLELEEVKGFWRDDARVKIKVAARLYPMFAFTALRLQKRREGGGWAKEPF